MMVCLIRCLGQVSHMFFPLFVLVLGLCSHETTQRLECVGSSLLFLYDQTGRVGIWMIDFGKTEMVEVSINHRVPWKLGNKEDGYLFGLDNLTGIFVGNSTR
eukprot:m.237597 g.237597  ORF g.237597 m.237597 type:complete len:102 (+) comp33710_c2_seq3:46-351(+)